MRYKLPEVLGAGECAIVRDAAPGSLWVQVEVGEGNEQIVIELARSLLTKIASPLPEEPPVGAYRIGGVLCMRVSSEPAKCWVYQTKDEMFTEETFADLCSDFGTDIVRLVPDPSAEPVALPWELDVSDGPRRNRTVRVNYFPHAPATPVLSLEGNDVKVLAEVSPDQARAIANALMTAADAAEKEQS